MRKALVALVILCSSSLYFEFVPDASALQNPDGSVLRVLKDKTAANSKISPSLTNVLNTMADAASLRNGAQSLSAGDFSTPLV